MAKKRVVKPAPTKRSTKHRVMLSFDKSELESLVRAAKEARLPVATYARLLVLKQLESASDETKKTR